MLRSVRFKAGYSMSRPKVISYYKEFMLNNQLSIDELRRSQDFALRELISFCFDHIPYYKDLFEKLNLKKNDFNTTGDLEKLPLLSKEEIKECPKRFMPNRLASDFVSGSTGGSTGVPLKYLMSVDCYCRGVALLYRGWGSAGYSLGDKVSIIAGASLVSKGQPLKKKMQDFLLNFHHYSSYGMTAEDLMEYVNHLERWKPSFLRGYATSLYLLAKFIDENNINLRHHLKAVFSTSEVLTVSQRRLIEQVFSVKVFDNYGLNDGGVSAYECSEHNGMHIDMERSVLEVVDNDGLQVEAEMGRIIATSLHNYSMPLLRYDTGDLAIFDKKPCQCGCARPLLKQIYGRITDYLKLNNKIIGSPVLTVLMGEIDVESYQIVQTNHNAILLKYVNSRVLSSENELFIRKSFSSHAGDVLIDFKKVEMGELKSDNKHKFIVNDSFR